MASDIWQTAKADLKALKSKLAEQKGARDQLLKTMQADEEACKIARAEHLNSHEAHLFLQAQSLELRQKAIHYIEGMVTPALRMIYGPRYRLKFHTFDDKRKDGAANFKMEIRVGSPYGDSEVLINPRDAKGGGLMETISIALRFAALDWKKYQGPIFLDEVFRMISNDHKIEYAVQFQKDYSLATGRQIVLVTHMGDTFGESADKIIWTTLVDGSTTFKEVNPEELRILVEDAKEQAKKEAEKHAEEHQDDVD